jgi:hypothetical protein
MLPRLIGSLSKEVCLKSKAFAWVRTGWKILTEVPGWPDAPVAMQLRRAMPVLLPCAGMVMLLDWNLLFHAPRVRDQQAALGPLLRLETEISHLHLVSSSQQLQEAAEQAAVASELLLESAAAVPSFLDTLKVLAAERGWEATFIAADSANSLPPSGTVVGHVPVRGKLVPKPDNHEPFGSLLGLLDRLSSSEKRIDLIRLAVRADEHRWQQVELNFRLSYALPQ